MFWGLFQIDLPVAYYVRSLRIPWLERAGDIGNRLGSGIVLVGVSGVILTAGVILKQPVVRAVGLETLLAHAVAGLIAQALKHAIGRPRPRFMHGESPFLLGPSFQSGLDSFPSGHASASFAVATVVARHFPKTGWVFYSLASLVALSRIVRGSHFPTDVMAGVGLGLLVGYVIAHPVRAWGRSLFHALTETTPFLVSVFGLIWISVYPSSDQPAVFLMVIAGILAMLAGMGARLYRKLTAGPRTRERMGSEFAGPNALIVIGLALTSGSRLVTMIAVFVSLAYWVMQHRTEIQGDPYLPPRVELSYLMGFLYHAALIEVPLAGLLIFSVFFIQQIKGLLPLLP
ncbi:MAG: phosphatase PAP2 family protein [Nitrospiraceae bacterium]